MTLGTKAGLPSSDFSPRLGSEPSSHRIPGGADVILSWELFFQAGGRSATCCFIVSLGKSAPSMHPGSFPGDPKIPMPWRACRQHRPQGKATPHPHLPGQALQPLPPIAGDRAVLSPRITHSGKTITHTHTHRPERKGWERGQDGLGDGGRR